MLRLRSQAVRSLFFRRELMVKPGVLDEIVRLSLVNVVVKKG